MNITLMAHGATSAIEEKRIQVLCTKLKGISTNLHVTTTTDFKILNCIGCYNCWLGTPGKCIHRDGLEQYLINYVNSDIVVILTPIVFGCYSSEIKNVMERTIPIISPYFQLINNEMHHKKRYERNPDLLVLGYGDATMNEVETMRYLVYRNGINLHGEGELLMIDDDNESSIIESIQKIMDKREVQSSC